MKIRMTDVLGLVAGYALAGLLLRTLIPAHELTGKDTVLQVMIFLEVAWVGLAMSGPIILARAPEGPIFPKTASHAPAAPGVRSRTWAENAWLLIGVYWIALILVMSPLRLPIKSYLAVVPIIAGLGLRFFVRPSPKTKNAVPAPGTWSSPGNPRGANQAAEAFAEEIPWSHYAALGLLWTWPLAWLALIMIAQSLGME